MTRPVLLIFAMALLTFGPIAAPVKPAMADKQELQLSRDGQHWARSLDGALFDGARRWVPGDSESVQFWVRNNSGSPAKLQVEVFNVRGRLVLGRDVLLAARVDGQLAEAGRILIPPRTVGALPLPIDLMATIPEAAGNDTQLRSVSFRLRISLTGEPSTLSSAAPPTPPGSDLLPGTGAAPGLFLALVVGLALTGSGVLVRFRSRSRL